MVNPSLISAQGNRSNFIKYRKQVILMLATVVVSFFTCLLPFRAFTLWIILVPSETIMSLLSSEKGEEIYMSMKFMLVMNQFTSTGIEIYYSVLYFCRCMWYLNSAMNPILYNLMSSKFREGFVKLLGCKPLMRATSWSDSARKGTFHTTSTNLSSSNHGHTANSSEIQRLRNANLGVNDIKSIERAPLNVIKYVKIVVEEKIASFETQDMNENSDCESTTDNIITSRRSDKQNDADDEKPEKNVNNSKKFSINSYPNKQKSNYRSEEHVKICSNDKCLPVDDEVCDETDIAADHEKDFCINIYNLLSAKESLV